MKSRIVIAGVNSGSGKTTITSGLMRLFTQKGYHVQGFKSGPDYIDPSYHGVATGKFSKNLDTWMLGEDLVKELLIKNSQDADLNIIEGVMGLFDGRSGSEETGSTSHLAKLTSSPVILVLDARSIARSAAAIVYGFMHYDPDLNVKGVILNKVASQRHLTILEDAIKPLGIEIIGHVMRNEKLAMPERHLGLIPATEMDHLDDQLDYIASELEKTIDTDKLMAIAAEAPDMPEPDTLMFNQKQHNQYAEQSVKIAYAFDKAFSFYYHDGLDYLRHLGAELIEVSPLFDQKLPEDISGLILGGGFPELFLEELRNNAAFVSDLTAKYKEGLPIFAECGGFMYMNKTISDFNSKATTMLSFIPGEIEMTTKLVAMGYRQGKLLQDCIIGKKGDLVKGHEFHYSRFNIDDNDAQFSMQYLENEKQDGFCTENMFASYLHFHFAANPDAAKAFLDNCVSFKQAEGE